MSVDTNTEFVTRDFVRDAISRLSEALKDSAIEFDDDTRWEAGTDGDFRERKTCYPSFWRILGPEWLHSLPNYQRCVECLKADPVVGPHCDHLVGTTTFSRRLETDDVMTSLLYAMIDDEGRLAFTDERFQSKWREMMDLFGADRITSKMVAPFPYLVIPEFPLRLNDDLEIDRLTADEVTRCCQVGVIRPVSPRFRLVGRSIAVGLRRTVLLPKVIEMSNQGQLPGVEDEGTFGNRPLVLRDDLVVDDVLSAIRLLKRTRIRAAGFASWVDCPWLEGATSYREIGRWPYGGETTLSESEIQEFLELWRLLGKGAERLRFSIHRFNLAFDRGLMSDRIVDLVIAAEALLLSDTNEEYRGELRFRFALRAAKFLDYPRYTEHDVFRIMRRAYDARSAIVHGGFPKDTKLPNDPSANLSTFTDAVEDLVRHGLRKALSMNEEGGKMREPGFWENLMFTTSKP